MYFQIDQQTQLTLSAYDTLCGGTTICLAATIAVYIDTSCTAALESEDAGSLCSGSCRSSFNLLFNACPDDVCCYLYCNLIIYVL